MNRLTSTGIYIMVADKWRHVFLTGCGCFSFPEPAPAKGAQRRILAAAVNGIRNETFESVDELKHWT
jgi:hypothetical protein